MEAVEYVVLSGDRRQPRVEKVSSGEGGAHFFEFYQKIHALIFLKTLALCKPFTYLFTYLEL